MTRRDSRAIEAAAALWLVKQDGNTWRAGEREEFEAWLHEDTAHRVAFLRLQAAWRSRAVLQALRSQGDGDSNRAILRFPDSLALTH